MHDTNILPILCLFQIKRQIHHNFLLILIGLIGLKKQKQSYEFITGSIAVKDDSLMKNKVLYSI